MRFLGLIPQRFLGVDVGTSAIRMVELSGWAGRKKLENYGEIPATVFYKKEFRTIEKDSLSLSTKELGKAIKAVMDEAQIETNKVAFSIPDFSTFFTTIELPPMTLKEVPQAVRAEARRHVPMPLGEVTLDWQLTNKPAKGKKENLRILLATVPNEVINQYQSIAEELGLNLLALEAEIFGLMRALIAKGERGSIAIVDIGGRSTTCSIVSKNILKVSHSFDVSGNDLTERISKGLSTDYKEAENLKKEYGITSTGGGLKEAGVRETLLPLIDVIIREIDNVFKGFSLRERKNVEKIILAGGTAFMPGLFEYFKKHFTEQEIKFADPFKNIFYPPILNKVTKKIGPAYAIATGMALRGLQ